MINDLTFGIAVVLPVALAVYNIMVNNRSTKKRIIIISAVFVTVFAASFGLGLISNHNGISIIFFLIFYINKILIFKINWNDIKSISINNHLYSFMKNIN